MANVLIDRCTLRVIRRGGWSWGPNPKSALEGILRALPDLLGRTLDGLFSGDEEHTYEAPVRISLKLRVADLAGDSSSPPPALDTSSSSTSVPLESQIERGLCLALGKSPELRFETLPQPPPAERRFAAWNQKLPTTLHKYSAMQRLLLASMEEKELDLFLSAFTAEELEVWHAALHPDSARPFETESDRVRLVFEKVEAALRPRTASPLADRPQRLRLRLLVATEIAAQLRLPLDDLCLWSALDRIFPSTEESPDSCDPGPLLRHAQNASIPVVPESHPAFHSSTPLVPAELPLLMESPFFPSSGWTTQVQSALPFLLLGALDRIGYLTTLQAVLEAAHLTDKALFFAAGFAYKVSEPPARGWLRSQESQHTAAAFAGSQHPLSDDTLHDFSTQMASHTGLLERKISDCVLSGREKSDPILLRRADSEHTGSFLLLDPRGCFPFLWSEDAAAASIARQDLTTPLVLVSREASGPRVLRDLDRANLIFITEAPPAHGESWRPIIQGIARLGWTNHPNPSSEFLARAARQIEASSTEAAALWEQLGLQRLGIPRAAASSLERHLTLAAAVALGILAWQLWKGRGRTTPQLALERLGDLSAHIRFSDETVAVGLPLGRRQSELFEAGLLAPVSGVPWFAGRRLEFGWG
jgi:hypothetical protein